MFDSIRNWFKRSYHRPSVPMSSPEIGEVLGTSRSRSGEPVTTETALTYSPVWQATDLISSDISRIPLITYRRVTTAAGEGKERDREHPAYKLLRRYTGQMTSNMWLVRMIAHALLYGNAYTRLRFNGSNLVGMEWIHSDRVEVRKQNGKLFYIVHQDPENERDPLNKGTRVPRAYMFHLQGLAVSELGGMSIVHYARNTIGRAMAAEGFGDDFYANGGPSTIFQHPGQMSAKAQKNFLKQFQRRHAGRGNRFKFGIVEEAMSASNIGVTAEDALLIDSLKFSVRDVARYFNIPPHKLGDDSRTSFNSTEQENMSYFNSSLGKWTSRIEFEGNQKLFTPMEREADSHFCEFKVDALFKANTMDRMQSHAVAVTNGIKSRNEVRAEENLNPYEGGEEYLTPLNMSADSEPDDDVNEASDATADDRMQGVVFDAYERAVTFIFTKAHRASKDPEKFAGWLNDLSKHDESVFKIIRPSFWACGKDEASISLASKHFLETCADRLIAVASNNQDVSRAERQVLDDCQAVVRNIFTKEVDHDPVKA